MNRKTGIYPVHVLVGICLVGLVGSARLQAQGTMSSDYTLSEGLCVALAGRMRGSSLLLAGAVGGSGSPLGSASDANYTLTPGVAIPDAVVEWISYVLGTGWNLCGAPGVSSKTIGQIFKGTKGYPIKLGNIQYYQAGTRGYVEAEDDETLRAEKGFFVFSYWGGVSREFLGERSASSNWQDGLSLGWNLYSPAYNFVYAGDGAVTIYRLNSEGEYEELTTGDVLAVGRAYWVYFTDTRTEMVGAEE